LGNGREGAKPEAADLRDELRLSADSGLSLDATGVARLRRAAIRPTAIKPTASTQAVAGAVRKSRIS
jgi:hypothetical protein